MPVPADPTPPPAPDRLLSDMVFDRISAAILDGTLEQGEVLRDADLQRWLGVSRTPIREALGRLAVLGLVESAPSRYTRVTSVDEDTIRETLEYTGLLSGLCVRLAVPRLSPDEITEAMALVDAMIAAGDDAQRLYPASRRFVAFMAERMGNRILSGVLRESGLLTERNLRSARPLLGTPSERAHWYERLREAIRDRDAEGAESALRRQHELALAIAPRHLGVDR